MLTSACLSHNPYVLDKCSTGKMSYRSHWETSHAVQSDTHLFEYDGQIPYQQSLHDYEKKPSNAIGMFPDDTVDVFIHSIPWRNEAACYVESINDCLMTPMSSLNTVYVNAQEDSTYLIFCAFHIQNPSTLVYLSGYLPDCEISQVYEHIGSQMYRMKATRLLVSLRLLVRCLLEYNNDRNVFLTMRHGQQCPICLNLCVFHVQDISTLTSLTPLIRSLSGYLLDYIGTQVLHVHDIF